MRKNNFNGIAFCYDLLVSLVFGKTLGKAQAWYLNRVKQGDSVLILGGGTGLILEQVLKVAPSASIDYVEASGEMLKRAKARVGSNTSVNFVLGTQKHIPHADYDCIITPFVLDVFGLAELKRVSVLLAQRLAPGGILLCTDFRNTGRWHHKLLLWFMHRFFAWIANLESKKLLDIDRQLQSSGLKREEHQHFKKGLIFTGIYKKDYSI